MTKLKVFGSAIVVCMVFLICPFEAEANEYQFTSLYSNADGLSGFTTPAINDNGVVTFRATRDGNQAILSGDGDSLTTIAELGASFDGTNFAELDRFPAINNEGTVVFKATLGTDVQGVYTGNGGSPSTIADTAGPIRTNLVGDFGVPDINNSGTVLFAAGLDAGGAATFTGSASEAVMQVLGISPSSPSINDSGVVGYGFNGDVFTGQGDIVVNLSSSTPRFTSLGSVDINNQGTVAFGFTNGGVSSLATADLQGVTIVADDSGAFSSVGRQPAINNQGDIAFLGNLDGTLGLFIGGDPVNDRVIVEGDPLFGSTLSSLQSGFFRHGFNNRGQFAFTYRLENGQSGIAVATAIPEPGTALLLVMFSSVGFTVTRRRTTLI